MTMSLEIGEGWQKRVARKTPRNRFCHLLGEQLAHRI